VTSRGAALAIVLAGIASLAGPAPGPASAVAGCPPIPTTVKELIRVADEIGPLTVQFRPVYGSYSERAAECFGDAEIAFDAFVAAPEGLGGVSSYRIEPLWLTGMAHFVAADAWHDPQGIYAGPFFPVAVPPALEPRFGTASLRWVRIAGHFNDPVADGCLVIGNDSRLEPIPTAEQAIAICRTFFVVTSIENATTETPTPTPPPAEKPPAAEPGPTGSPGPPSWVIVAIAAAAAALTIAIVKTRRRRSARRPPA
jgi:hypothetical protein